MTSLCSHYAHVFFIKEHCINLTPYVAHRVCMQHISSSYAHVSLYHNFMFFWTCCLQLKMLFSTILVEFTIILQLK